MSQYAALGGALLLVTALIGTAGALLYRRESQRIHAAKIAELTSIAKLKADQVRAWCDERLMDVEFGSQGPTFVRALTDDVDGRIDHGDRALYEAPLRNYLEVLHYDASFLVRADGQVAFAATGASARALEPAEVAAMAEATARDRPTLSEFFAPEGLRPRISAVAPIHDRNGRPLGFLVLRRDPEHVIFPMLRDWPTPSPSAATVLVRRDGDAVLYITGTSHRDVPSMTLRTPIEDASLTVVRAMKAGHAVTVEGRDYRGVEVVARIEPVPGTEWMVGAKLDLEEIRAETRYRGIAILGFALLGTLLAALGVAVLYNRRQQRLYRELFEAEQQRRREEEEFRTTVYSVGDAIITTDANARVSRMNPMAEAMTGWHERDARGHPLDEVFRIVDEQTGARVASPVERVLREGRVAALGHDTLLEARDGTRIAISSSGAPVRGDDDATRGVVLVFSDQTERRRNERTLETALRDAQTSRDQLRGVVDSASDLIAAIDADYRFITFNRAYAEEVRGVLGVDLQPGDSILERLAHAPAQLAAVRQAWQPALAGQRYTTVREFGEPGRERKSFELAFNPIRDETGAVIGAVQTMRDVTERARAERALAESEANLRRLNEDLERIVAERTHELVFARDEAERSNRIKDVFLATMSHELRTPLNSIIGFSDILLGGIAGELNAEQKTQLGIINKSGLHLLALISDVLDISKIEAGQLTLRPAPIVLAELLQEQERVFTLQARDRGLAIRFEPVGHDVRVLADAQRLRQVIGNLLSNALKYTDRGAVGLVAEVLEREVRITVWDSGIGIPLEEQPHLFKPFRQVAPQHGGSRDGTGLGLAISRRLVEAMGGAIGVTSEPGRGSRFWFTLPRV